jgi:hypothetical protein
MTDKDRQTTNDCVCYIIRVANTQKRFLYVRDIYGDGTKFNRMSLDDFTFVYEMVQNIYSNIRKDI